ncbi:MAG: Wzz/FepE/Etk N-terminal domain-containing protein [Bacteroidota bacterium]
MHDDSTVPDVTLSEIPGDGGAPRQTPPLPPPAEGFVDDAVRDRLWWIAGVLFRRKWLIVGFTFLAAVAAAFLSLQMPNWYRAEARVLLPESSGGLSGLLDAVAPGAGAILGQDGGSFTRYRAILTSRTTLERIVDQFDLVDVYETLEEPVPEDAALRQLAENTDFPVSLDYDYLGVQVLDRDPNRAAQIANVLVDLLNERHIEMSASSARENRLFLERRLTEAEAELDSVLAELQAFQEQSGVVEIEAQTDALMSAVADAQSQLARTEVEYEALRSLYGDENPDVQAAAAAVASARRQVAGLAGGDQSMMPVPIRQLPAVGRRYAELTVELTTQKAILEVVRPLYEQSVLTERQEVSAVQVLDPAIPPTRKAEPRRTILVLGAAFAAGFLITFLVLLSTWLRQRGPVVAAQLRSAAS